MKKIATLKELSQKLGLSISTISRALSNHPDISAETKKRVKELAELLEYEPNVDAIKLKTNKSKVLGIIVPSIQNSFYGSFIAAVEEEAKKNSYTILILQSWESIADEIKNIDILRKNRVDAIFISLTIYTEDIKPFLKIRDNGTPVIFFGRVPQFEACDKISVPDQEVGSLAARCLIESHKKHVLGLFWGNPHVSMSQRRLEAFEEVFRRQSPGSVLDIFFESTTEEAQQITAKRINSNNPPDAVFCSSDNVLIGTMLAVHETGLKVPEQIGVISISNGLIPTLFNPKITYIETSGYKAGKLAYNRLLEIFSGKTFTRELYIDSVLVPGGSL